MPNKQNLILKRFAENLSDVRASKELSLQQVASRCELSRTKIHDIETGEINVTLITLFELAKGLGVSPGKLVDFSY